jgi:hypothetical protein
MSRHRVCPIAVLHLAHITDGPYFLRRTLITHNFILLIGITITHHDIDEMLFTYARLEHALHDIASDVPSSFHAI